MCGTIGYETKSKPCEKEETFEDWGLLGIIRSDYEKKSKEFVTQSLSMDEMIS